MIRGLLIALLLSLAAASPATAQLTVAEKADVKRLVESVLTLREGKDWLIANIDKYDTPATHGALYSALWHYERAQAEHQVAFASLLHLGHVGAGSVGIDGPNVHKPTATDEAWHAEAWRRIDLYLASLTNFEKAVRGAKVHFPPAQATDAAGIARSAAWQKNLDVTLSRVLAARAKITAMDRTLKYLTPWPPLRPDAPGQPQFTVETAVGPHGDYRLTGWALMRQREYIGNAHALAALPAYKAGAAGSKIAHLWSKETPLRNISDIALALLADVTFTAEQAAEDRFCRVLRVRKMLTVDLATAFNNWQSSGASFVPQPWANFISTSGDAWRHFDLAVWKMDLFPESTRCESPFLKD